MGYSGRGKGAKGTGSGKNRFIKPGSFEVSAADATRVLQKASLADVERSIDLEMLETSVHGVASYEWLRNDTGMAPLLRIPGAPRAFRPSDRTVELPPDGEEMIVDEDLLYIPLNPEFSCELAIRILQPEFPLASIDCNCGSNSLRKLLGYIVGDCSSTSMQVQNGMRDCSFKIYVDPWGPGHGTLLTRVESRTTIPPFGTFGQSFANHMTTDVLGDTGSYHRVSLVHLGKLAILVSGEADACEYQSASVVSDEKSSSRQLEKKGDTKIDCVVQGDFITEKNGTLIEIKTKNARYEKDIDWTSWHCQMVLGGMQSLCLGLHTKGHFGKPIEMSLEEVRTKVNRTKLEHTLSQLEALLQIIRTEASNAGGSLDLFCAGHAESPLIMKRRG